MTILVNGLTNLPHRDGQRVLVAERDDCRVTVIRSRDGYHVDGAVKQPSRRSWANLEAERKTIREARSLARELWTRGKEFDRCAR
jgi:hypothetical protein